MLESMVRITINHYSRSRFSESFLQIRFDDRKIVFASHVDAGL